MVEGKKEHEHWAAFLARRWDGIRYQGGMDQKCAFPNLVLLLDMYVFAMAMNHVHVVTITSIAMQVPQMSAQS